LENGNSKWADYKNGFGAPSSDEYWMGLDQVHNLTRLGNWELLLKAKWSMKSTHANYQGWWAYAIYNGFKVDDECAQYRLHVGQRRSQRRIDSSDYFRHQNGKIFRTSDQNPNSCTGSGAWWHVAGECKRACFNCNDNVWYNGKWMYADLTEMFIRQAS